MVLFGQGRFAQSLEEALTSLELAPSADEYDYRLVKRITSNLRMLGQPATALAWYHLTFKDIVPAHTILPHWATAMCNWPTTGVRRKNTDGHLRYFRNTPKAGWGFVIWLSCRKTSRRLEKSHPELATLPRDFAFSQQMAAQVEFFSRNFAEAEKLYKELAANNPSGGASFYGVVSYQSALGRLRQAASDEKAAQQILQQELNKQLESLKSAPHHPEILYQVPRSRRPW